MMTARRSARRLHFVRLLDCLTTTVCGERSFRVAYGATRPLSFRFGADLPASNPAEGLTRLLNTAESPITGFLLLLEYPIGRLAASLDRVAA